MSAIFLACAVVACDGPRDEAGEQADVLSGATGGESSIVAGPAEKAGERKDREQARDRDEERDDERPAVRSARD